jgi:hypothetical protein
MAGHIEQNDSDRQQREDEGEERHVEDTESDIGKAAQAREYDEVWRTGQR